MNGSQEWAGLPDQRELSQRAALRYQLDLAVAEARGSRRAGPPPFRRARHRIAGALVATARLIDAT